MKMKGITGVIVLVIVCFLLISCLSYLEYVNAWESDRGTVEIHLAGSYLTTPEISKEPVLNINAEDVDVKWEKMSYFDYIGSWFKNIKGMPNYGVKISIYLISIGEQTTTLLFEEIFSNEWDFNTGKLAIDTDGTQKILRIQIMDYEEVFGTSGQIIYENNYIITPGMEFHSSLP